jgi:hypothetical protein
MYATSPGGEGVAVGGTEPRVLAVTNSASLVIGLTFSHRGWDVASQTPDAETPLDGDVIVFDLRTTRAGLEAAEVLRPGARALVIGDEDRVDDTPAGVQVLVRPYTVDDLTSRIEHLLSPAGGEASTWADPPEFERAGGSATAEADGPATKAADSIAPLPAVAASEGHGGATLPAVESEADTAVAEFQGSSEGGDEGAAGRRGRRVDRSEHRRTLASRLFGRVAEEVPETAASSNGVVDASEAAEEAPEAVDATEAGSDADADRSGVAVGIYDDVAIEVTPYDEGAAEPEGVPVFLPPPPPAPVPPMPAAPMRDAPAATTLLERRVIHVPEVVTAAPPAVRPTRWRARRQKTGTVPERRLRERLARVLSATSELEKLVDEVPLLAELPALASAVVREVQQQLDADTVGLWRPAEDGWRLSAHRGLTRNEATWIVPFDQPLFSEVHATGGALLLDPVDAVQAAVAGIGGAHTESFMAAAVAAGPGRYGILAVGRDRQLVEEDLDVLGDLALEMAPGLAVAEQLERLRGTGSMSAPAASGEEARRPWRTAD